MLQIENYVRAATVQEAVSALTGLDGARVMAGGTDVLVAAREKGVPLRTVVDIKAIPGLDGIQGEASSGFRLGALASIHAVENSSRLKAVLPHLVEAASQLGSYQIRHRATLGGNLCNASPAAETACPLLTAGAGVTIASAAGQGWVSRHVPLAEFFVGPGRTALGRGELLLEVFFPAPQARGAAYGSAYLKLGPRRAMDIAVVNVAAVVGLCEGRVVDARLAVGSVAPTPVLLAEAAGIMVGREPDEGIIVEVARRAQELVRPISDVRASAWYRREMVRELTARAIHLAVGRAHRHG